MSDETTRRGAFVSGGIFAVVFFVGLILVGDLAGAFADSENFYAEIFSDNSHRVRDLTGSVFLIISAIAFGVFAHLLAVLGEPSRPAQPAQVVVRVAGTLAAASILAAGAAFLTVPASLLLGDFYGDPGIVSAQPILPSVGYILLVVGAAIAAPTLMVASVRLGEYPTWLTWVTVITAVLLVVTAWTVSLMVLLPIWVAAVALVIRGNATAEDINT